MFAHIFAYHQSDPARRMMWEESENERRLTLPAKRAHVLAASAVHDAAHGIASRDETVRREPKVAAGDRAHGPARSLKRERQRMRRRAKRFEASARRTHANV